VNLSNIYGVEGSKVDRSCYNALIEMIDDCNAQCPRAAVISSYRTWEYQQKLFDNKVNRLMKAGLSQEDAQTQAATVVAVPGTSEHQLGLAVDIIDTRSWQLDESQEDQPAQKWLMENSWKYGFILRYPPDTTEFTGIIYEPWHYRYVGKEIAAELHELGVTLEEYLRDLTED
jgi:D-alanyl-D-alanine carboxypeptidase